jgi:serine O-acetyltransferase
MFISVGLVPKTPNECRVRPTLKQRSVIAMPVSEPNGCFKADRLKYYLIELGDTNPSLFRKTLLWFNNFGLHCVAVFRFGKFAERLFGKSKLLGLPFVLSFRVLNYVMRMMHHVNIEADIGPGFYIGHVGNIYVGPVTIGANCSLTHNVTIGFGHTADGVGVPTIGDNVWIGTGSTISGKITIADRVTVVNGSVLSRSAPEGSLVGGNPARVILREYDNRPLFGEQPPQS